MNQSGVEWLKWRRGGIGGSDVAAVLGISPWMTIAKLYEEKISTEEPVEKSNYIQEKGKRIEPKARAIFEFQTGKVFTPHLMKLEAYPYVRCSLDGKCDEEIIEIKLVGDKKWKDAQSGIIPDYYMCQVQWCLLISGAAICHYISAREINDGLIEIHTVPVLPNPKMAEEIFLKVTEFWFENVQKRIPPGATDEYVPLTGVDVAITEWKRLKSEISELEEHKKQIEDELKALVTEPKMTANGVKFTRRFRSGTIQYDKVPQLQGVDLEPYRKAGIEYVEMK